MNVGVDPDIRFADVATGANGIMLLRILHSALCVVRLRQQ